MKTDGIKNYLLNCFLLMVPLLVWNLVLTPELPAPFRPEIFQYGIPPLVLWGENISRLAVFLLTALMPLSLASRTQRAGLVLYILGVAVYVTSWLAIILYPDSGWSHSATGFMAPAYTPALWLTGIGLIGDRLYFNWPYRSWVFLLFSSLFLAFHNVHTSLVYDRLY